MHYSVLVLTDAEVTRETAHDAIEPLLEPFVETYDEQADEMRGHWDWWVVGGRWTGALTDDYDPSEDPQNWETCRVCNGTGERPGGRARFGDEWYDWCHGCNGCEGKGWSVKWPTDWADYAGDTVPAASLNGGSWPARISAVLTPEGEWHGGLRGDALTKDQLRALVAAHRDATAIVVDCHV